MKKKRLKQQKKTPAVINDADNKAKKAATKGGKEPKRKRDEKSPEQPALDSPGNLKDSIKTKIDSAAINKVKADSLLKNSLKAIDSLKKKAMAISNLPGKLPKINPDTLLKKIPKNPKDSLNKQIKNAKTDTAVFNPADTVTTRIIRAYHNVKIFKSNIQAKTDSLFYTSADSTLRCYGNPIIWSEGSQVVGDTIYVQFKKNKLNNLQAFKNAFLVSTPKDSLRFNQIKGRYMTGFFSEGKLKNLYVDGNAESIYYTQDDSTKVYKEMNQTLSSRIKFTFKNNDIDDIVYINSIEGALNPENKVSKDNVLKGFSWKPKERPKSKRDAIGSSGVKKPKSKVPAAKTPTKTSATKSGVGKAGTAPKTTVPKVVSKSDSVTNYGIKPILPKKDSTIIKRTGLTKQ